MEWLATLARPFLQWLWQTTLIASLVICLILVAQKSLGHKLGPRWSHALWLVLLIRMAVPWAPQSPISLLNLLPSSVRHARPPAMSTLTEQDPGLHSSAVSDAPTTAPQDAASSPSIQKAAPSKPQVPPEPQRLSRPAVVPLRHIVPVLWLAGAALVGAYLFADHFALWRIVKRERPLVDQSTLELFEECKAQMGVQTLVAAVPSDRIGSPALFGFVRPRLLLPRQMLDTASRDEMRYVFLHELAHLKRHDIYLAWVASLLQVLHWFNPLVWFAFHRMRTDREMACDALVLAYTGERESQEYGRAIVALLQRLSRSRPLPAMAGILESKSQLKRRIAMIAQFKNNSYRWSPLAVALVVALGCASLPDAGSGKTPQPSAAVKPAASVSSEQPSAAPAGESNVFVDPNTGIRFTKLKTISGPSDVMINADLDLSPNGKFLLWRAHVIPLDAGVPFDLVDIPYAHGGAWSPDGRNVVFSAGAIWLIQVDPETARPVGSARKLLDGDYGIGRWRWSSDSKRIVFLRSDDQVRNEIWSLSIENRELSKVTDPFEFGLVSPDGRTIACSQGQGIVNQNALLMKPVAGGEAKKVKDRVYPVAWSADSQWLLCKPRIGGGWQDVIRFIRVADRREAEVISPGYMITPSPQGGKLAFYHGTYEWQTTLKVISVAGGPAAECGWPSMSFTDMSYQLWTSDSQSIIVKGERKGAGWGLWAVPLDGKDPRLLTVDTPLCRPSPDELDMRKIDWVFSPDANRVLLFVPPGNSTYDLWVMPISLPQMRSTGPAVKVFGGQVPSSWVWEGDGDFWSPEGTKIAFCHKGDIWVASADGKTAIQLTKKPPQEPLTSGRNYWPDWSPDGTMIAFCTQSGAKADMSVRVVPASGGEAKLIADIRPDADGAGPRLYAWSPDGKELTIVSQKEGIISNFPISGGDARIVLRPGDMGISGVGWLRWSPDGRALGFHGSEGWNEKVYIYHPDNAKLERFDGEAPWYWSPDGKWISFFVEQPIKTRPVGIVWEMDVEEAITKLGK